MLHIGNNLSFKLSHLGIYSYQTLEVHEPFFRGFTRHLKNKPKQKKKKKKKNKKKKQHYAL